MPRNSLNLWSANNFTKRARKINVCQTSENICWWEAKTWEHLDNYKLNKVSNQLIACQIQLCMNVITDKLSIARLIVVPRLKAMAKHIPSLWCVSVEYSHVILLSQSWTREFQKQRPCEHFNSCGGIEQEASVFHTT